MRPESSRINPLDLNNLPDDFSKHAFDDTSSSGSYRKKKSGGKQDGKDEESGKVYECRFCSLKFCKSQALGGHMNRHRQERETETLNRARQLVFNSENLAAPSPHHLGCHPAAGGSYHPSSNFGDPYRSSVYPPRIFSGSSSSSSTLLPTQQPFLYTSPSSSSSSRIPPYSSSQYPQQANDYYIGHVLNNQGMNNYGADSNYTCIGAPVVGRGGADGSLSNQEQVGLNWGRL